VSSISFVQKSLLVAALVVGSIGCSGGSDVDTYDVSGTVTYNGQPVANVNVTFNPQGGGHVAVGKTDAQGRFSSLTTRNPGDGAAEGEYVVTLSQIMDTTSTPDSEQAYAAPTAAGLPFPTKYLNTRESDLRVSISADGEKELTLTD
jgi:hypothetical protein